MAPFNGRNSNKLSKEERARRRRDALHERIRRMDFRRVARNRALVRQLQDLHVELVTESIRALSRVTRLVRYANVRLQEYVRAREELLTGPQGGTDLRWMWASEWARYKVRTG